MTSVILNEMSDMSELSYLELGVCDNKNFNQIKGTRKMSVDINGKAMFTGTTDEFFVKNSDRFDVIYIDANHDIDYVVRDFNNSCDICDKFIVIHDMVPPNETLSQSRYCSDSYKLLHYFMSNKYNVYTMNENMGLTFVLPKLIKVIPNNVPWNLSYQAFMQFLADKKLYSYAEMVTILNKK